MITYNACIRSENTNLKGLKMDAMLDSREPFKYDPSPEDFAEYERHLDQQAHDYEYENEHYDYDDWQPDDCDNYYDWDEV